MSCLFSYYDWDIIEEKVKYFLWKKADIDNAFVVK